MQAAQGLCLQGGPFFFLVVTIYPGPWSTVTDDLFISWSYWSHVHIHHGHSSCRFKSPKQWLHKEKGFQKHNCDIACN
jgi:hypothetical protein